MAKAKRPSPGILPLKFNVQNYYELRLPKAELNRLIGRHNPAIDPDEAYDLILGAFDKATIWLLYTMDTRYGPTSEERTLLVEQIAQLSRRLLIALTSDKSATSPDLGAIQYEMFTYAGQLQAAADALPALTRLNSAAQEALKLKGFRPLGGVPSARVRRGRPVDYALNILFSELMLVWEKLTGTTPELTVNYDGEATCPFCLFFQGYFGSLDPRLSARAIADRCKNLEPAIDISVDETDGLRRRFGVED
jgi:hypothetical protein